MDPHHQTQLARQALSRLRTDVVLMLLQRRGVAVERAALHAALLGESSTRKVFDHFLRTGRRMGVLERVIAALRAWSVRRRR